MSGLGSAEQDSPSAPRRWLSQRLLVIAALLPAALLLALLTWAVIRADGVAGGLGVNNLFGDVEVDGRLAPDFTAKGLDGNDVTLSDARGKVVMLDFWASWCPPCRQEAPALTEVYEEYRDKGVEFIGVAIWDRHDDLVKYVERFEITYPNALDDRGRVAIEYGVAGIPEKYFIDRAGNVVKKFVGPTSPETLRQVLDELLGL